MSDPVFDSRKLDAWSYFCCKLGAGNYTVTSVEAPGLSGALVVAAAASGAPGPDVPSVVFTSGADGKLAFANLPPFAATDAAYITFSYSGTARGTVAYSVQISGAASLDSRTLMPGQIFGYCFLSAGSFIYKAYLLIPGPPGSTAPPQYVLKQQGQIAVQDNAPPGDPLVISLDPATPAPAPVVTLTGLPVSWEASGGPWYVVTTVSPPTPQSAAKQPP